MKYFSITARIIAVTIALCQFVSCKNASNKESIKSQDSVAVETTYEQPQEKPTIEKINRPIPHSSTIRLVDDIHYNDLINDIKINYTISKVPNTNRWELSSSGLIPDEISHWAPIKLSEKGYYLLEDEGGKVLGVQKEIYPSEILSSDLTKGNPTNGEVFDILVDYATKQLGKPQQKSISKVTWVDGDRRIDLFFICSQEIFVEFVVRNNKDN